MEIFLSLAKTNMVAGNLAMLATTKFPIRVISHQKQFTKLTVLPDFICRMVGLVVLAEAVTDMVRSNRLGNIGNRLSHLNNVKLDPVLLVLGNEACDLDSAVSSVVYAFYLSKVQAYPGRTILPVLNIPRSALRLRTEVTYTFKKEKIPLDSLICKDEIDIMAFHDKGLLEVVLVDQNVLRASDKLFESAVIEIIDHHKEEYQPHDKLLKVQIEPVGSCCTLVAEKILQNNPEVLSPQVAMLLYSAILIDTTNLSNVTKRATPKDVHVVEKLQKILDGVDRKSVYEDVQKAKDSVEDFTVVDLLQKDQKVVAVGKTVVAFSTLVVTLQDFISKTKEPSELENYCTANSIDVLVLLNSIVANDTVQREVAVYSSSEAATEKVCKILEDSKNPNLSLKQKILEKSPVNFRAFDQENLLFTRKAVLPLVRETMSTTSSEFSKLFGK